MNRSLALIIVACALGIRLLVSALIAWSVRRRNDRHDWCWGQGAYSKDTVTTALDAVAVDARPDCTCEGCEYVRAMATEATFRLTEGDIAELYRNGITWGQQ